MLHAINASMAKLCYLLLVIKRFTTAFHGIGESVKLCFSEKHFNEVYVRTSEKSSPAAIIKIETNCLVKKTGSLVLSWAIGILWSGINFIMMRSMAQKHKQINRHGNLYTDFAEVPLNIQNFQHQVKSLLRNIRLYKRAIAAIRLIAAIAANIHRNT